jgi:hypothetical protein
VDSSVRQTVFEDDSPRLTSGNSDAHTRSIVVNRDDAADAFRSAQLPSPSAGSTNGNPTDQLRNPFTGPPSEQPQLQTPQLETPPAPENNVTLPAPQNNTPPAEQRTQPPAENPPFQAPPIEQPPISPGPTLPPPGQFQPVLPSGPTTGPTGPPAPDTSTTTIESERGQAKEACEKSLQNLRAYTVDKVNLNINITGTEGKDYPFECSIDDGTQHPGRCWQQTTYLWKASAMCHKPLYFEDVQLERYGHSWSPCFQPFISGAHFFCELPVLPYCMGVEPPCECIYALGYYRPGSCAPYMWNPIPLSPRGGLIEAGAVVGTAAILP